MSRPNVVSIDRRDFWNRPGARVRHAPEHGIPLWTVWLYCTAIAWGQVRHAPEKDMLS